MFFFICLHHIYVCIRAGRLTDGPYTSYDLNTLLKATAGQRRAVLIGQGVLFVVLSGCKKLQNVFSIV